MKHVKSLLLIFLLGNCLHSLAQYQFTDKAALQTAVDAWCLDSVSAETTYGHINTWDVSSVTDMTRLFSSKRNFNSNISSWDVSNVTNMSSMFYYADVFNGDLSSWDVSNVTDMSSMFSRAESFHGDLSSWDVSNVTDMSSMFSRAESFHGDLSSWDVSNVTDMSSMFRSTGVFNQDLSSWDVSNVTNMSFMFTSAGVFNGNLSSWDVSSVENMSSMFQSAGVFNQDLSSWDVSNVTNMISMFQDASSFNGDVSGWNVSSVNSSYNMFRDAASFNQDVSLWDVSNITDIDWMFDGAVLFNQDLSVWNVSNCTYFSNFLSRTSFSVENYNKLLAAWSQLELSRYERFGVSAQYCDSVSRQKIIDDFGWTITDEGLAPDSVCNMSNEDIATALVWDSLSVSCQENTFSQTIRTTDSLGLHAIGVEFVVVFDPDVMSIASFNIGDAFAGKGSGRRVEQSPGRVQFTLFMDEASQGDMILQNEDLLVLNWSLENAAVGVEYAIEMEEYLLSYSVGYTETGAADAASFMLIPQIFGHIANGFQNLEGSSSNPALYNPTKVAGMNASCDTVLTETVTIEGGEFTLSSMNVASLKIEREVVGDQNTNQANCAVVTSVINAADVNRVVEIINGTYDPTSLELLAADVNLDGAVTAADASLITSRSINLNGCEFPQSFNYNYDGTPKADYTPSLDWMFIDKTTADAFAFDEMNVPLLPTCLPISENDCSGPAEEYKAIFVGDVNNSWRSYNGSQGMRIAEDQAVLFDLVNIDTTNSGTYLIPVLIRSFSPLYGVDLVIDLDKIGSEILSIVPVEGVSTKYNVTPNKILLQTYEYEGIEEGTKVFFVETRSIPSSTDKQLVSSVTAYVNGELSTARLFSGDDVEEEALNIFPNPAQDNIVINWETYLAEVIEISVVDVMGRNVLQNNVAINEALWTSLDITGLSSGTYQIKVTTSQGSMVSRFVKK